VSGWDRALLALELQKNDAEKGKRHAVNKA
jgi:hypothetical protein